MKIEINGLRVLLATVAWLGLIVSIISCALPRWIYTHVVDTGIVIGIWDTCTDHNTDLCSLFSEMKDKIIVTRTFSILGVLFGGATAGLSALLLLPKCIRKTDSSAALIIMIPVAFTAAAISCLIAASVFASISVGDTFYGGGLIAELISLFVYAIGTALAFYNLKSNIACEATNM